MNLRLPAPPTISLQSNRFEEPINVDVQAFLDFSFWMSEELLDLESRFSDPAGSVEVAKVKH